MSPNSPFRNADYIWAQSSHINDYCDFIADFIVDASLASSGPLGTGKSVTVTPKVLLYISVDWQYAVYVNGSFVNCGQYTDYEYYKVFDALDISPFVHSGKNTLQITACWQGESCSAYRAYAAGLIFSVHQDGVSLLDSGPHILARHNPCYSSTVDKITTQLGYSFYYDATKYTDSGYAPATVVQKNKALFPRPIKKCVILPPVACTLVGTGSFTHVIKNTCGETMQYSPLTFAHKAPAPLTVNGTALTAQQDGAFAIVDLGQEETGLLELRFTVPNACKVLIGWGEHLEDGRVRTSVGGRCFCATYMATAGQNHFFYPFKRLGCRYVQLFIYSPEVVLSYCGLRPMEYPVSPLPFFADPLEQRIYDVSVRTLLLCMHEHYEDCPWREQALYAMDSRNQMLCGYYAFGEYPFAAASLRLLALSLRPDGLLELCAPAEVSVNIPSFSAIFFLQCKEYLQYSGDQVLLLELLPCLVTMADAFLARIDASGLLPSYPGYWNFYEWQQGLDGSAGVEPGVYECPLNAFVAMGLNSLADVLDILDKPSEIYRTAAASLAEKMNQVFWSPAKQCYATRSDGTHFAELTNAVMAYAGFCGQHLDAVLSALAGQTLIPVTLSHTIFKYEALMQRETYRATVFADIKEKWGYMLSKGATTFWETLDGAAAFDDAGSLCHGWSAVPVLIYRKYGTK